jgi:hypothetical protein
MDAEYYPGADVFCCSTASAYKIIAAGVRAFLQKVEVRGWILNW